MDRTSRPLIGLTGRVVPAGDVRGLPASFAEVGLDLYVSAYAAAVAAAGGLPLHLPQGVAVGEYAGVLDGLLLTGGGDVEPARYGAEAAPETQPPEPARDAMELALLDVAVAADLPVVGICRGLQVLNVHGGGTLHQHVEGQYRIDVAASAEVDEVRFVPGSRMAALYGPTRAVNSLHHQTVDRVAAGWSVAGRNAHGGVEAIEWDGHDVIAVQWHPEMMRGAATDPLFAWLVDAAARRRLFVASR